MSNMVNIKANGSKHPTFTNEDGSVISGVCGCFIQMKPNNAVRATIEILPGEMDIDAEPLLGLQTVREAARKYGYRLVRIVRIKESEDSWTCPGVISENGVGDR